MIRVDTDEQFSLMAGVVDGDAMAAGLTVNYDVRDSSNTTVVSGVLQEDANYNGVYCRYISLTTPGNYRAFYETDGYPVGSEEVIVNVESLYKLIKQTRHNNISVENVMATVDVPSRKVQAGQTNYVIVRIKDDAASDWAAPVKVENVYAWYTTMGATQPFFMGANS